MEDEEIRKELEKELMDLRDDLEKMQNEDEYLEDVLDVERTQNLVSGYWVTQSYRIQLSAGGPDIWVDEEGLKGYWGSEKVELPHTEKSKEKFQAICEYLDDTFE
jgi:hypothetical protein